MPQRQTPYSRAEIGELVHAARLRDLAKNEPAGPRAPNAWAPGGSITLFPPFTPRWEPKEEIMEDYMEEYMDDAMREDMREELEGELRYEIEWELRRDLREEIEEDLKEDWRYELMDEVKEKMRLELEDEMYEKLSDELRQERAIEQEQLHQSVWILKVDHYDDGDFRESRTINVYRDLEDAEEAAKREYGKCCNDVEEEPDYKADGRTTNGFPSYELVCEGEGEEKWNIFLEERLLL